MHSSVFFYLLRTRNRTFSFSTTKVYTNFFSSASYHPKDAVSRASYANHLINTYNFSESEAASISKRLRFIKDAGKPVEVIEFLRKWEFSEAQIRKCVNSCPQILYLNTETILKPKFKILRDLGISESDLGNIVSKNTTLLTISLENKLIPCIENLKKFPMDDKHVIRVICKCRRIFVKDPNVGFLPNLRFLESYGVVGSQISTMLKIQPYLFVMPYAALKDIVTRVREMGLSIDSRMFAYALDTMVSMKKETFSRKLESLQRLGLTEQEAMVSFRKAPFIFKKSEEGLRTGIEFYLKTAEVSVSELVSQPSILMYSVKKRLLPRYKVVSALKSKSLCNKDISFKNVATLSEQNFLKNFILKFKDQTEELMNIYYDGNVSVAAA